MYGLLNINKPPGKTSRDAVNRIQRLVRPVKVGHAGTLDPLASGVLVMCLGPATRLIQYVQQLPKRYTGTFLLGRRSDTDDTEGQVIELERPVVPTVEQVMAVLGRFIGTIQQRPPIFSAIKVQGRRAYELARAGKEIELEARPVNVYGLEVVRYEYPDLVLDIHCGGGTYIRSLGRDLAESLGTATVMSKLERTAIGHLTIESATELADITEASLVNQLLPAETAVRNLPAVELSASEIDQITNGRSIERPRHGFDDGVLARDVDESISPNSTLGARPAIDRSGAVGRPATVSIAAFDADGQLVAIVAPRGPDHLRPISNLAVASKHAATKPT